VPTVTGGTSTGLFNTYSTRTLLRGQFNFGVFWHNYDRDPGDLDINRVPVNFAYAMTDRLEVFGNIDAFQQVTTRQPFLLSGTEFNRLRILLGGPTADPFVAFGPPRPGTSFFPGNSNRSGSILPPVGAFVITADGRRFVPFDTAGYYNEFPFFPFADTSGMSSNPRMSSNGLGNITVGVKAALTDPNQPFSVGLAGIIKIPTATKFDALADGRGAGVVDAGPILILSEQLYNHRLRFHQNIGYMFTRSVHRRGVNVLDRRDELIFNTGIEVALAERAVYLTELNNTVYVGGGTPNLNSVNPMDLRMGARFFFFDGRFHIGGAWQIFLNNADTRTLFEFVPATQDVRQTTIQPNDANGFVVHIGFGKRPPRVAPPPPNRPPTVNLEADKTSVEDGESVKIFARAADPDNDLLIYTWSTTAGQISGSGPTVILNTAGVNPTAGAPPVLATVSVTVDDGRGGSDTASMTITVNSPKPAPLPPPPPPNRPPVIDAINYELIGTPQVPGQITDGETVRVWAIARDPDGDPLTYRWSTTAGKIIGTESQVTLDTTGATAGPGAPPVNIGISLTVDDGKGGTDSKTQTLTVHSGKKHETERIGLDLEFPQNNARVNNVHKAILDDVALRLRQEPTAVLVIDGHADKGEPANISRRRAEGTKDYLVKEKGIDANRIVVRFFGTSRPHPSGERARNRRVELWFVPAGAEMPK
jgi:outer membrane protein OmpA-like peptidoglycan-associated protein